MGPRPLELLLPLLAPAPAPDAAVDVVGGVVEPTVRASDLRLWVRFGGGLELGKRLVKNEEIESAIFDHCLLWCFVVSAASELQGEV